MMEGHVIESIRVSFMGNSGLRGKHSFTDDLMNRTREKHSFIEYFMNRTTHTD